jgi:elongation factor G
MKEYHAADIRNFAVVGHASSGKTVLCDAMLACAGHIGRIGSIEAGTTASDYHEDEHDHGISIHASLLRAEWLGRKLNIIDCPGYADFISEARTALRVSDFALVVTNGCRGVEVGTDIVWKDALQYDIPCILAVNLLDKPATRFDETLEEAREHFGSKVFPMTIPLNAGPGFNRVLDVIRSEVITFKTDGSGAFEEEPAEGELAERVRTLHRALIEFVAESDDELLTRFLETDTLSEEELRGHLHEAIQRRVFIPLFAVSGQTNVGVARLMDFIAKYGSSPVDRARVIAHDADGNDVTVALDDPDPVAFVFKTLYESHVGELSFFRLYSGSVSSGTDLLNVNRNTTERIGQMFSVNGRDRVPLKTLFEGDIAAAVRLRDTHSGNTLCGSKRPVTLPMVEYPKPKISGALQMPSRGDEEKVAVGLAAVREEDPTFRWSYDPERKQTIIEGQGEIHLQIVVEALQRRFNVAVELAEPRVPYRETIRGRGESRYRHKKQSGGAGQFAEVWMRVEPLKRDSGVEFCNSLVGNNVDRVFVPSVEKGVAAACAEGVFAGYRVVDVKVDFYDGKQHPVDSKDIAFQIAGKSAFQEAFRSAKPCLLEPILNLAVTVPDDCVGTVMGDLTSRRGRIVGVSGESGFEIIRAQVPQAEMHRYATHLRSLTGGRGIHEESFSHYEEMPREIEERVLAGSRNGARH